MSGHCSFCGETGGCDCSAEQQRMGRLAERIPPNCEWSTGTGTKRSHAQIIAPYIRKNSFYAVANSEEGALRLAIEELEQFVATTRIRA